MKVYKENEEAEVPHPVDVQGWLNAGWSLEKGEPKKKAKEV